MAETSWPTVAGSHVVGDDQYDLMTQGWGCDGIFGAYTNAAPVFGDSSGRQVKIRANRAGLCGGRGYSSGTSDTIKSIGANASGSTRIDLVVMGLDRTTWAVTTYVKAGTPGAGVPPALQRDARGGSSGKWEVPLASVNVINAASTISAGDVTDIAWYAYGDTVATVSTSPLLPPVADYPRLRYTDTNTEYTSVSGSWRRADWSNAWGLVGGRKYTGSGGIYTTSSSFADSSIRSGSVALLAGRRYIIEMRFPVQQSASSDCWTLNQYQLRKSDGSTVIDSADIMDLAQTSMHVLFFAYEPGSNETQNFQLWTKGIKGSFGTTYNWSALLRGPTSSLQVTDVGLAATVAVA